MASPEITPEEAIRKVLSLPASRRAAALRELLHGNRAALNKALEMLPTMGNAPQSVLGQTEIKPEIRVGHYLLRSVLGEGGFGIVWLAEQDEPLRRSVAFKILRQTFKKLFSAVVSSKKSYQLDYINSIYTFLSCTRRMEQIVRVFIFH